MKAIALYLPQFHSIPENDEWWGKGFTEWTNVKKSKSLFKGHIQPEVPLNNDYYNLLDPDVLVNQANMAKKYGIYGFCYYHYWFVGKLLLEKPLENMLKNKSVDIPFCLSWANESWARTWDGKETDVLIKQNYEESQAEWENHFEYLLNFFKDERYIKVDNKPMLIIYKPFLMKKFPEMVKYWNEMARKAGFDGIYFGYQYPASFDNNTVQETFDFGIEFEPLYTNKEFNEELSHMNKREKLQYTLKYNKEWLKHKIKKKINNETPTIYDYDEIWQRILKREPKKNNIVPGAFPAWDNTPRKGIDGIVYYKATPEKFEKYLKQQIQRAQQVYHSDFIFINAWNEWGEGAHLEPDEDNKYGYLEAVKKSLDDNK